MSRTHTLTVRITVSDPNIDPDVIAEDIESGLTILEEGDGLAYEVDSIEVNPEDDRYAF